MAAKKSKNPTVVVFGEGDLAVAVLEEMSESFTVQLVVTRPPQEERPIDGTRETSEDWSKENDVDVVAFEASQQEQIVDRVNALQPDLILFTDFHRALAGELFPDAKNCCRVHCSLLPKLRGADPLRRALDQGDKVLGVSFILCDEEPYGGPVLGQREIPTDGDEKYGLICDDVFSEAAELAVEIGTKVATGKRVKKSNQNHKISTQAGRMTESHRKVPWVRGAGQVANRLRAFAPQPGLKTLINRRDAVIEGGTEMTWETAPFGDPGTFLGVRQGRIMVLCGANSVFGISRIGWEGEEAMSAAEFMARERLSVGARFV